MNRHSLATAIAAIGLAASAGQGPSNPVGVLGPTKAPRRVTNGVRLSENRPRGPACAKHGVALKRVRLRVECLNGEGKPSHKRKFWQCRQCTEEFGSKRGFPVIMRPR